MTLTRVDGTPAVQWYEGLVAAWVGDAADPAGLAMDAVCAVQLAARLVALVDRRETESEFVAEAERIQIFPPEQGAPGRLTIEGGGHAVTFFIDWPDIVALADTAKAALTASPPSGQG